MAAHRTLPFGSILRVTNLNNGRDVQVRVIDRGPFVGDRILDLARAAAVSLDMIGTGTARVRIELLSGPNPAVGDFTVQIGAFADRANAERLRDRLLRTISRFSFRIMTRRRAIFTACASAAFRLPTQRNSSPRG